MKLVFNSGKFQANLLEMWQAKKYCDIVVIGAVEKHRIPAHRLVLEASSPYFAALARKANGNMTEEIVVTSVDGVTLKRLLETCYSGTLEVNENNVSSVYIGAAHLQFNDLLNTMDNYIVTLLNISNCLYFYHLAETLSRSMLFEATKKYICKHFSQIINQPSFSELNTKQLKGLLTLDGLQVSSAEDLFRNIIKWIEHDADRQQDDVLYELLPYLRLSAMSPKYLQTFVKPQCKTLETKEFLIAALETALLLAADVGGEKRNERSYSSKIMNLFRIIKNLISLLYVCICICNILKLM